MWTPPEDQLIPEDSELLQIAQPSKCPKGVFSSEPRGMQIKAHKNLDLV